MAILFIDPERRAQVLQAVNDDAEFKLAGRFFSKDILLVVGDARCIVSVRDGVAVDISYNPSFMSPWSFYIRGAVGA